jgi:hypothetical protein
MSTPSLEVADVVRELTDEPGEIPGLRITTAQRYVLEDIVMCRTAGLGGHVERCDHCKHEHISYNSCGNRHCPKCLASKHAEWLDARKQDLLTVPYFHVVFTLHQEVAHLALQNKKVIYKILFRAASETLKQIAADPKHLGAEIGFLAVLHTWGQTLLHHPHLHCVVPGGGLSQDKSSWVPSRDNFFLPVQVLSAVYRGKFLHYLRTAYDEGKLQFSGKMAYLSRPIGFKNWCRTLKNKGWVVYSKPPFGGPKQVLTYLARYTHRVAIANSRLVSFENGMVSFRYKDYAKGAKQRIMSLSAEEFLRRFLLHVLPRRFQRIRYFGLLGNRCRKDKIALSRRLIIEAGISVTSNQDALTIENAQSSAPRRCPKCGIGKMVTMESIPPFPPANLVQARTHQTNFT